MTTLSLASIRKSMGGRPNAAAKKQRIGVYLSNREIEQLKTVASSKDMAVSEFVRALIREQLNNATA